MRSKGLKITFTLPPGDAEYLSHISCIMGRLGVDEHEAAKFILTREIDKMRREEYHRKSSSM